MEKLLLAGTGRLEDKRYRRAAQILGEWLGSNPFLRGKRGLSEEVIRGVGEGLVSEILMEIEERNAGVSPFILREALIKRGFDANPGFSELLYKCLKEVGACFEVRAVLPSSSAESKVLAFLRIKGSVKYSDIVRKFGRSEDALLNLLKKGIIEISYRNVLLRLDGVERFEGLSEEEVRGIDRAFLTRVEGFGGEHSYRISIPLAARVSLKWGMRRVEEIASSLRKNTSPGEILKMWRAGKPVSVELEKVKDLLVEPDAVELIIEEMRNTISGYGGSIQAFPDGRGDKER
ncbi:MAG: hypothetical protein ABWK01_06405 [Infirmifilum sp.]